MKNRGYKQDIHKLSYRTQKQSNSHPSGTNKTFEQYLKDIDIFYDNKINNTKKSYERISKISLVGEDLRKFCREWMLWEVKFDNNFNVIPLEEVLSKIEIERERYKRQCTYKYVRRSVNKDNQKYVYNDGNSHNEIKSIVRVPSIKRSKTTWKRFYELFPYYKKHFNELNNKNGLKLKKVW